MYTKEEASRIRQAFWTTFGQYMSPLRSAEGQKVNWINYKTGIKHVYFKMQAEKKRAWIAIEIAHPDRDIQELFFEQFLEFKTMFGESVDEDWIWSLHETDEHAKVVSYIKKDLDDVNVFNQSDWPRLISFFKTNMVALDQFWWTVKDAFDALK